MTKLLFSAITLLLVFSACSPRVTTQVLRSYPPLSEDHSVIVYELEESVPDSALVIGTFSVTDKGATTGCSYPQVVNFAVEASRKIGGNALKITEHVKPGFWGSSCHQIWGSVLRLGETDLLMDAKSFSEVSKEEIENLNQPISLEKTPVKAMSEIGMNLGYGGIINRTKGLVGEEKRFENKLSNGFTWDAYYLRVYPNDFGWGIIYSGYKSSASYGDLENDVMLTYIGPMMILRSEVGKWIMRYKLGIGYLGYRNRVSESFLSDKLTGSTVGANINLGIDYKISDDFSLGMELSSVGGTFSKLTSKEGFVDTSHVDKDNRMGAGRINILLGIRHSF